MPLRTLYLLAKTPTYIRDPVLDRLDKGEKLTPAEVAKYVKEVQGPPEPPREAMIAVAPSPDPPQASRAWIGGVQSLRLHLLGLEQMIDNIDGAAEELLSIDAKISRALFRKVGNALLCIGNTIEGKAKTASRIADKYIKPQK